MMKKVKFLLASLCLAFVCVLTFGFISLSTPTAKAEGTSYYYDTATIYDWSEISSITNGSQVKGNNVMLDGVTGGVGFANKGIKFKWTFNQDDNSYGALRFQMAIGPDNCNYNRTDTYYFGLDWGWKIWHKVRANDAWSDDVSKGGVSGWAQVPKTDLKEAVIEFSVVKAYDTAEKTNWVANLVTLKINGKVEVEFLDEEAEYTWTSGSTTYTGGFKTRANSIDRIRAVDATQADLTGVNGGEPDYVGTTYHFKADDQVKVYDWYDFKGVQSSNPENSEIGKISETTNVAFTATITPNQQSRGDNDSRYGIMFGGSNGGWHSEQGYALYLEWDFKFYYAGTRLDSQYGDAWTALGAAKLNKTHTMEFGIRKMYDESGYIGNYLYIKVDGVEKEGFLHKNTEAVVGTDLFWVQADGCDAFITGMTVESTRTAAENAAITVGNAGVAMVKGASVRYGGEQNNGIRFTMEIDNAESVAALVTNGVADSVSYGVVIIPADYITAEKPLTANNLFVDEVYGAIANMTTEELYEQESGKMGYSASLINILESNITRAFVGVGYVKYEIGETTYYALAKFFEDDIANNTRSIYEVAKAVYEDEEADEDVKAAVKAAYLDKCATYTANYYYGEETITKSYVGVIGQTVFAPYVAIEGYAFDATNAENVTTGVVAQDGSLVLNYYYTAVAAE